MEGDFNLREDGIRTGCRSRKTGKNALAILLSAVLAAGMCLPAYGAEAGEEDTAESINVAETAEAPAEEPVAEEPEEASEQEPEAEETEDSMKEMTPEQEEDPAAEETGVPIEAVSEGTTEEEETATGDRTAETAEEIVEGEAEELLAGNTSGWLSDYSYSVKSDRIKLEAYNGSDSDITVPGSAVVNGTQYNIVEISAGLWQDAESLSFDSGVVFPDNSSGLFRNMQDLQSIDLSNIDTSNVTDMGQMFDWCVQLTELDVSGFNTSKVTNMDMMFSCCSSLTSLDVTNFDTSKVTDMEAMFNSCSSLTSLDLSYFNTSNVTNMYSMFSYCGLTSLDLSAFNTSNVTNMADMFYGCSNLTSLNVSSFDTSKVTDMSYAFNYCSRLSSLDISTFDMSAVSYCVDMLSDCTYLMTIHTPIRLTKVIGLQYTYVDAEGTEYDEIPRNKAASICLTRKANGTGEWLSDYTYSVESDRIKLESYSGNDSDITVPGSAVVNGTQYNTVEISAGLWQDAGSIAFESGVVFPDDSSGLFAECYSLQSIDFSNVDTSNVTDMSDMFSNCYSLTSLDVSGFDTSNVTDMSNMFSNCYSLTSLDVSGFDTSNVTDMSGMFSLCGNLSSLDVSGFDTGKVTDMSSMFNCGNLTNLDVSGFDTGKVTDMCDMFSGCERLASLDVSGFDTSNVKDMTGMFSVCGGLSNLDVSGFDTEKVTNMRYMFSGCSGLTSLDVSGFETGNVTNMSYMFNWCESLTSLDLDGFDFSRVQVSDKMLYHCSALMEIKAPVGLSQDIALPDTYTGSNGVVYQSLPKTMQESLILTKGVAETITISKQPASVTAAAGETITFHVEADRDDVYYQWQWSKNGTSWTDCTYTGADTDTFSFTMKSTLNGRLYRCRIYNEDDEAVSSAAQAILAVAEPLEITEQPSDTEAGAGEAITFRVAANKTDAKYQWQWSKNGQTWTDCTYAGASTDTFSFAMKSTLNGRLYRCVVSSGSQQIVSEAARAVFQTEPLEITEQPADASAGAGEAITFHVATNKADARYQWQWKSRTGKTWTDCTYTGANTDTFSFTMKSTLNGRLYRCVVSSGSEQVISEAAAATFQAEPLEITEQPADASAAAGGTITFHVVANKADAKYQWQWKSRTGKTWTDCTYTGANTDTFSFTMKGTLDGRLYRCVVSRGSEQAVSEAATATFLAEPLEITEQPSDVSRPSKRKYHSM